MHRSHITQRRRMLEDVVHVALGERQQRTHRGHSGELHLERAGRVTLERAARRNPFERGGLAFVGARGLPIGRTRHEEQRVEAFGQAPRVSPAVPWLQRTREAEVERAISSRALAQRRHGVRRRALADAGDPADARDERLARLVDRRVGVGRIHRTTGEHDEPGMKLACAERFTISTSMPCPPSRSTRVVDAARDTTARAAAGSRAAIGVRIGSAR